MPVPLSSVARMMVRKFTRSGFSRRFLLATVYLLSIIGIVASGGGGDTSWLFPLWIPTDVVVTDIDGDDLPDVITLARLSTSISHDEGRLVVYRQTSPGVFAPPDHYVVGTYPWKLALDDIDGNGLLDLLVADPDSQAVWLLLQNTGNPGKLLPAQQIASGILAYEAAIADLNSDGVPDIAIADHLQASNRIVLLYQDPSSRGTFLAAVDFVLPGTAFNVTTGELNQDGRPDLIAWIYLAPTGYTPNGELALSLQQANGTLDAVTTLAPQTGLNVGRLAIQDYDGNGRNDLFVFFTPFDTDYRAKLTVLLQETQPGTFASPVDTSLAGIQGIDDATFADLNGDGRPDVAVAGFFPVGSPSTVQSRFNLFTQSGNGAFALAGAYTMPIAVSRLAAGDIDRDGLNDLVVLGGDNRCLIVIQSHSVPGTFNAPYFLN